MYKSLIKRKIAYLVQTQNPSIINSPAKPKAWQVFDEDKEKEIIVWIRQLGDKDKTEITKQIKNKFNISDDLASKYYFKAYPDGLSTQEEEIIDYFENILPKDNPNLIDESLLFITEKPDNTLIFDANDSEVLYFFLMFLRKLCSDRKLI